MLRLLRKLWKWLKSRFFPTPKPTITPPTSEPDNIEYENILMALLEEAAEGKSWGELQGFLISRKINPDKLAQWLQQFGQRWLEQPELHQELARRLIVLGGVATGRLGEVTRGLGEDLQKSALQQPQEDSRLSPEVNQIDRNLDKSEEKKSVSPEINQIDNILDGDVQNLLEKGEKYLDRGEYQLAYEQFQKAVELEPNSFNLWYFSGLALYRLERYEEALDSLNQSLQLNQNYIPALSRRGLVYQSLKQPEAAKADFKQAISIQPQEPEDWRNHGIALFHLGRYEEALASFDKALEIKPDDHIVWVNRGFALSDLGRYEDAIASYDKAIEFQPDDHNAWFNRGNALSDLGRYEQAIASFDKAIEFQPDKHEAWVNRGFALSDLGRHEDAIASYDKAIEFQPDDHNAWYNRGIALSDLGRHEEAIASYDKAIEFQPDDHISWRNRGNALGNLGRYEDALASFDKAIEFQPDDHNAWFNRGNALSDLGRYEQAIASYDKAIEFQPDDHHAWGNRGIVLCDNLGRYEEALASFDKAIEIQPDDHISWNNRGVAAGKSGGYVPFLHPQQLNPELNKRGYEGELASYRAGLKFIHQDTHPEGWGYLHYQIGKAQYFEGQQNTDSRLISSKRLWRQAEKSYNQALLTLNSPEFEELHLEVLQDLIRVLLSLKEVQQAQEIQRQGTDLLKRMFADPKRTEHNPQKLALKFAGFNQLTVDLAVQSGNLAEALTIAEYGKNTCLRWLLGTEDIPKIEYSKIQTLLSATTAAVYWHLSPGALTTFVLLPDQPVPILIESAIVPAKHDQRPASLLQLLKWEDWLKEWNKEYETYSRPKDKQNPAKKGDGKKEHPWRTQMLDRLDSLGKILNIDAIEDSLKKHSIQNLILIPHRDLHRFPLHYLFENYTCTYLPSAYLGLQQTPIESQTSNLLIVENPKSTPNLNDKPRPELPFAEVEAALIRQIYPQHTSIEDENDQTQGITCEAVQTALRQSHDIFHFTGHGNYNSQNPAQSCLFLSGTEQLTLLDIKDLDLSSYRLVCLAACETAVTGNQTITDEYVGLVSAFLKAGVTYVVSTLWTVESAATMLFMQQFYQNLRTEQPPPTALKNAQTWLKNATRENLLNSIEGAIAQLSEQRALQLTLEDEQSRIYQIKEHQPYCHPYYWAAFTISGLDQ